MPQNPRIFPFSNLFPQKIKNEEKKHPEFPEIPLERDLFLQEKRWGFTAFFGNFHADPSWDFLGFFFFFLTFFPIFFPHRTEARNDRTEKSRTKNPPQIQLFSPQTENGRKMKFRRFFSRFPRNSPQKSGEFGFVWGFFWKSKQRSREIPGRIRTDTGSCLVCFLLINE